MSLEEDFRVLHDILTGRSEPPHWVHELHEKLDRIEGLIHRGFDKTGEQIMALVTIDQADLDNFAATVETQVTALTSAATDIGNAATVLGGYITQLLANQAVPIPAGDASAINQAVADLTTASTALSTASGALTALEPVTPVSPPPVTPVSPPPVTPVSPTPVSPTPVSPTPVSPPPVAPVPVPVDPNAAPVQAGTLDPSTNVVEVPQGVVPVVVAVGATVIAAGLLPADSWVTPTQ